VLAVNEAMLKKAVTRTGICINLEIEVRRAYRRSSLAPRRIGPKMEGRAALRRTVEWVHFGKWMPQRDNFFSIENVNL
jgi:hypothetical protein